MDDSRRVSVEIRGDSQAVSRALASLCAPDLDVRVYPAQSRSVIDRSRVGDYWVTVDVRPVTEE